MEPNPRKWRACAMAACLLAACLLAAALPALPLAGADGPAVAIDFPFADDILAGAVNITGTSTGAQWVNVSIDGGGWNRAHGTDSWYYVWNSSSYSGGTHSILAKAVNGSLASGTVSVQVTVNNSQPGLLELVLDLSATSAYAGETFTASGSARFDNGVRPSGAPVQVSVGNTTINTTTDRRGYYSADLPAPASAGEAKVRALATASGLTATASAGLEVRMRDPPDMAVTAADLYFSPDQPFNMDEVSVGAIVRNIGGSAGNATVNFSTPGLSPALVAISVPAGGSWNPSVKWRLPSGVHNISVRVEQVVPADGNASNNAAWRDLRVLAQPDLVMVSFVASNSRPTPGLNITLQARIGNTGDLDAAGVVRFYDGAPPAGTPLGSVAVSVPSNSSRSVFLDWKASGIGEHTLFAAITNVTPREASPDNDQLSRNVTVGKRGAAAEPQGLVPGFGAPILAAALAAALAGCARRRLKS